jgi:prepilin-type N-terminal cleavage/methylation domain-containing protein
MREDLTNRKVTGFTLLELLVVVTIIGILVAILTVNFQQARDNARNKTMMSAMAETQLALELYKSQNGSFPNSLNDIVSGGYIDEVPQNYDSGNASCNVTYSSDGTYYKLTAARCYVAETYAKGVKPDSQFARCPSWCGSQGANQCAGATYNTSFEQSTSFYESLAVYSLGGECR